MSSMHPLSVVLLSVEVINLAYIIRKTGYGRSILVNDVTQIIVCSVEESRENELYELEMMVEKIRERKKSGK